MAIAQRRLLRGAVFLVLALALLAGCSRTIDEVSAADSTPPRLTAAPPASPTRPGDCVSASRLEVIDCARPHELEAYYFAELPSDFPEAYPTAAVLLPRFEPQCRARLVEYVGSPDVDASRLREYVYWPSPQGWHDGQRWVLCAVGEIGPEDQPLLRTGTLSAALRDGLGRFQACSRDSPSAATLRVVPCSEPHRGEAIPGVLVLGAPSEPPVTADRANAAADPHCRRAADAFLGGVSARPGVRYSWRYPLPESWVNGYTAVVCYLETEGPVRGSLRDP